MGKLTFKTKLGYGMGDIYGGGATTIISMYYLYFLTDVLRISPVLAGTAFLISKIWDAVTDPFMGIITDNTRTRFGRRRPYFLAGVILIFVSFALMWLPVPFQKEGIKFLYVIIAYLFFSTVYTIVMVPYNSIAAELTNDYDERTKLSTYRMIFSNLSGILAGTLAKDIFVDMLYPDDQATGFFVMSIVFGLLFALPYIGTFFFCKEPPEAMIAPKRKIGNIKEFAFNYIAEPLKLRAFRFVVFMYLFGFMAQDAMMAMAIYFLTYCLGISSMMTLLLPIYGFMLIAIPLVELVAKKLGKRKTYMVACVLWVISFSMVPFLDKENTVLIYVFGALFGAAAAGIQVMVFALFPDIPDADELYSGERREGLYSGIFSFIRKAGGAITMFFVGNSIQWAGYKPPLLSEINGVLKSIPQQQTSEFQTTLTFLFIMIPCSFIFIAFISCYKYPLTKSCHDRLKIVLEKRRGGETLSPEITREEQEIKAILEG